MSRPTAHPLFLLWSLVALGAIEPGQSFAQLNFDQEPIRYQDSTPRDPVARLQEQLNSGSTVLQYNDEHGYLDSVLEELRIPASSQMLVFSKTSLQLRKISPRHPRALYFNDNSYVGFVQNGDVLEISAVDRDLGAVFYTLSQEPTEKPQFLRDRGQCLTCHASSRTQGVPGFLVRSVFADPSGQPHFGSGTFNIDDSSPFENRWGGWYVTGTHGSMRHMGNAISHRKDHPEEIDRESGANLTDLQALLDTSRNLRPTSDIVALMVLEHQARMHNLITLANYETRSALFYNDVMATALGRPTDVLNESTQRRIAAVGDKLLSALLFTDEFQLTSPVKGVSGFAEEFQALGPRDSRGRSLRDLDLQSRLFKYPCSYLIGSESFAALPREAKLYITRRLREILEQSDPGSEFSHLTPQDCQNIREILTETMPGLLASDDS